MRIELQEKLFEKYPKMFDGIRPKQGVRYREGISCGDGWFDIIDQLCGLLQFNTDTNYYRQTILTCCKEKFGGLRFYTMFEDTPEYVSMQTNKHSKPIEEQVWFDRPNAYLDGMVTFAESLSEHVCDVCGAKGEHSNIGNWIATRCPLHKDTKNV